MKTIQQTQPSYNLVPLAVDGLTRPPMQIIREIFLMEEFLSAERARLSELSLAHFNSPELPHSLLQVETARRSVAEREHHLVQLKLELGSGVNLPEVEQACDTHFSRSSLRDIALAQFEQARSICSAHYTRGTVRVMERWKAALEWVTEQYEQELVGRAAADHAAAVSGM